MNYYLKHYKEMQKVRSCTQNLLVRLCIYAFIFTPLYVRKGKNQPN